MRGEDEVGVLLGQEIKARLGAAEIASAEDAARAERDLGLEDVIAVAQRILLGVEEGEQALALVVAQLLPQRRALLPLLLRRRR